MVLAVAGTIGGAGGGAHETVLVFSLTTHTTRVGDPGERLAIDGADGDIAFVITPVVVA